MHEGDPKVRQAQLDEGRRFIDLAQKLKTPYVRVFGDKVPPGEQKRDVMARVIDGLRTLGEHAKGSGVTVLLETHGDYTDSPTVVELMKGAAMDTVALVWDAHHTFVAGKEQPSATLAALKPWVRHTHLKDSRPEGSEVRYVLTGSGTVPVREQVRLLKAAGYKGYYGFEWEKGWHPEIEEPEVAFPHFVETIRGYRSQSVAAPDHAGQPVHRTFFPSIRVAVAGSFRSSRQVGWLKWITRSPLYETPRRCRTPARRSSASSGTSAARAPPVPSSAPRR